MRKLETLLCHRGLLQLWNKDEIRFVPGHSQELTEFHVEFWVDDIDSFTIPGPGRANPWILMEAATVLHRQGVVGLEDQGAILPSHSAHVPTSGQLLGWLRNDWLARLVASDQ